MAVRIRLGVAFYLSWSLLTATGAAQSDYAVYVFSRDSKFVKIDPSSGRISDLGDLRWLRVHEVNETIRDPQAQEILITTKVWRLLGIENPTREEFGMSGIVVLKQWEGEGAGLGYQMRGDGRPTVVAPPSSKHHLAGARIFDEEPESLYVSWRYEGSDGHSALELAVYDRSRQYRRERTLADVNLYDISCLSDGELHNLLVYTESDVVRYDYDLRTGARSSAEAPQFGGAEFFSRSYATLAGCRLLVRVHPQRPTNQKAIAVYYLYDVAEGRLLSSFERDLNADFHLLTGSQRLLANEYIVVRDSTGSFRKRPVGRLHVLDPTSGGTITTISLVPEGRLVALSPDEREAFYFSPQRLDILDLEEMTLFSSVEVPFRWVSATVLREPSRLP